MNKLAKLKQELAALRAEGLTIIEAVEKAGRDFNDDEDAQYAAIEKNMEAKKAEIEAEEKLIERRRTMEAVPSGGGPRIELHDQNPELTGGFKDIGEFAMAVHGAVKVVQTGGIVDSRLMAITGNHTGGGTAGEGYALPPMYRDQVWELVNTFDEFGPLIDEEPTSAREVKLTTDETTPWGTSGIQSYWRAEGSQMTASKMADTGRSVPLHDLYTLALGTEELLEDAVRLRNRLTNKAAQAIAWKKNKAIVEGTGSGQPLGWMKSGALLTVAKETSQAADTILAANVLKMFSRLKRIPGDKPFWMINQTALPQLAVMTIGDKPVWMPPNGLMDAPGGYLLGLPVRFSEFAEVVGDAGDIQLISPKGYYGVRRASGVKFASSIHLYFDYNTEAFRWVFRYGGQPHLSAPVTPAKGGAAATQSHFVTLAARA